MVVNQFRADRAPKAKNAKKIGTNSFPEKI
jgi:hypothetical protein